MSLFSVGCNSKLDDSVYIFNLPALYTCLGSTKWCRKRCYAQHHQRMFNAVMKSRVSHWTASLEKDFVDKISEELEAGRPKLVRIHESGDFYSKCYYNKWIRIAKKFPKIKFLAFTKNHHLDFSKAPKNFAIRFSIDYTSDLKIVKTIKKTVRKAYVLDKLGNITSDGFTCKKTEKYCGDKCTFCWDSEEDVGLPEH